MTTSRLNQPSASQARRRRTVRWILVFLLVTVLAAAGAWYWRGGATNRVTATAQPTTITISIAPYSVTIAGPGLLEASRSLAVTSKAAGTVLEIAEVGMRVVQGQTIARLDPTPFERALRDAEFDMEKAQAQLAGLEASQADSSGNQRQNIAEAEQRVLSAQREEQRARDELALTSYLRDLGTESASAVQAAQDTYDTAVAELASAQSALDRLRESLELQATSNVNERRNTELAVAQAQLALDDAQADLDAITVSAPFDGVIAEVATSEGASVQEEGTLLTLIGDSMLSLPVQIDETQIAAVALGQQASVALDAIPDESFPGTVTAISPVAQIESNIPIFYVTVTVANPELRLRPGMTAEAEIVVEEFAGTATVPLAALRSGRDASGAGSERSATTATAEGGSFVLVREADGSFASRAVTLVDSVGFDAVVTGDLDVGDEVLVAEAGPTIGAPGARGAQQGGFPAQGLPGAGVRPPVGFR